MTEKDIMNSLECCVTKNCEKCIRNGYEDCENQLKKDAMAVIKMMNALIKMNEEEIKKMRGELQRASKLISVETAINIVNEIVEACMGEDTFREVCDKMLELAAKAETKHILEISSKVAAPKIVEKVYKDDPDWI